MSTQFSRRFAAILIVLVLGVAGYFVYRSLTNARPSYPPRDQPFDGDSTELKGTIIVPTLDTPAPEGTSIVWCASMQLAWNRFAKDVVGGPIQIEGAEEVCERLNRASVDEDVVTPADSFVAAGRVQDGVVEDIRKTMRERFPKVSLDDLPTAQAAMAFAYLRAEVRFKDPFPVSETGLKFRDGAGHQHTVQAFGTPRKGWYDAKNQVRVLYLERESSNDVPEDLDFALDLCNESSPYQVVVARLSWKGTLHQTLKHLDESVAGFKMRQLKHDDTVIVPLISWNCEHHFQELVGSDKKLVGSNLYFADAIQIIKFHLDAWGAEVESWAAIPANNGHTEPSGFPFHLDRPFLVYMKKRDAKQPLFVMWVDNAELLLKQ